MKKYDILNVQDFNNFLDKIASYIAKNKSEGKPFKKMSFAVKSYKKERTSKQLKFYWVVMAQLSKAFRNVGYDVNKEQAHEFVKTAQGFTEVAHLKDGSTVHITKSISDSSDEINIKRMMDLIDFAIRFAAEKLDWIIEDPR